MDMSGMIVAALGTYDITIEGTATAKDVNLTLSMANAQQSFASVQYKASVSGKPNIPSPKADKTAEDVMSDPNAMTNFVDNLKANLKDAGVSDRLTGWNPTNHAYWNLNGHDAGDARKHRLEIPAERYVPVGPDGIPNDRETDVAGTRYDFRTPREIDGAYDNCFVLSGKPIRLWGERGIGMEVRTDNTAVQLYNAAYLSERIGKCGAIYRPFGAVCLETEGRQTVPGSPIAAENVLNPGRHFALRETCYQFLYEEK
jgi:hypothetical protein